jgi:hypothetical protein
MIRITTGSGPRATIELSPPTPAALLVVRGITGRTYHPRKRAWSIPRRYVDEAVIEFAEMGLRVFLNGQTQAAAVNPFVPLKSAMPPDVWRHVSAALARVLDPERGGDARLHALLRRTRKANQERRTAAS